MHFAIRALAIWLSGYLAILALGGCMPRSWDKPDGSRASYNSDSYACERDVRQSRAAGEQRDMYARCMQAAGWSPAPAGRGFSTVTP